MPVGLEQITVRSMCAFWKSNFRNFKLTSKTVHTMHPVLLGEQVLSKLKLFMICHCYRWGVCALGQRQLMDGSSLLASTYNHVGLQRSHSVPSQWSLSQPQAPSSNALCADKSPSRCHKKMCSYGMGETDICLDNWKKKKSLRQKNQVNVNNVNCIYCIS